MTAKVLRNAAVSEITLAVLEATNWYKVNFSMADSFVWGKSRGCTFLTGDCIINKKETLSTEFCNISNIHGCTIDHTHKAVCSVHHITGTTDWDWFGNDTISKDTYSDNCPYFMPID